RAGMRRCPLCNAESNRRYMKATAWNNRHGLELKQCSSCGFVFTPTSLCNYPSSVNPYASATKLELLRLAKEQNIPILVQEIIQKAQLSSGEILDFGCGVGLTALCLQELGFSVYGIESCQAYLDKHKELTLRSAKSLDALNALHNGFDLIIIKDVLEHVDYPKELLKDITTHLKPGGYLYVRVPNRYHYNFHWSIDTKSHINHFSPRQLSSLCTQNSLTKIDFIGIHDISTQVGKLYNSIFWRMRKILPLYHQISMLYQKAK
ncbi:MAG TPA: class I SAM-dependent methyltransferase, partial [Candidatus Babeliaceae bacterium]|nr:class I SAM-dependent methyltransferase [Candidatus Babeliaceae bacterium]